MNGRVWNGLAKNYERARLRFKNLSPADALHLYWRALRLHWGEVSQAPQLGVGSNVVVSLSTIPSRIRHLRPVLYSLLDQSVPPGRVILALPTYSLREKRAYPTADSLKLPAGVEVLRCEDYGPATKFVPARLAAPGAALVIVDDDVIYPPRFIEALLTIHQKHPLAALGYRGVRLSPGMPYWAAPHVFSSALQKVEAVDVLLGTWGILVPPQALVDQARAEIPTDVRWVDDIWLSGTLARHGIARLVAPSDQLPIEALISARNALSGTLNRDGLNDQKAIEAFADAW